MSIHRVNNIDTNIKNYTLSELMAIVQLQDLDPDEIAEATDKYIKRFSQSNPVLSAFFTKVQSELLMYSKGLIVPDKPATPGQIVVDVNKKDPNKKEGYQNMNDAYNPSNQQQQNDWDQNQYLEQDDPNQTSKITNRQQTTQTFGNDQVPMNQQQISTTDTYNLPVKQDSLNPTLTNTVNRFVNLDSQFRKYTNGLDSSSTDYTLDLSDTLKDALSLRLFSFQIPMSWYAIDKYYGNTCFWIFDGDFNIAISMPSGNYTQSEFVTYLAASFEDAGFDLSTAQIPTKGTAPATYNANNGKLTLYLNGVTYNPTKTYVEFTITANTTVIFYDFSGKLLCENNCFSKSTNYLNSTLGWLMGYRLPYIPVDPLGMKHRLF